MDSRHVVKEKMACFGSDMDNERIKRINMGLCGHTTEWIVPLSVNQLSV